MPAEPVEVNLLFMALAAMIVALIVAWKWEGISGLAFVVFVNGGVCVLLFAWG